MGIVCMRERIIVNYIKRKSIIIEVSHFICLCLIQNMFHSLSFTPICYIFGLYIGCKEAIYQLSEKSKSLEKGPIQ